MDTPVNFPLTPFPIYSFAQGFVVVGPDDPLLALPWRSMGGIGSTALRRYEVIGESL